MKLTMNHKELKFYFEHGHPPNSNCVEEDYKDVLTIELIDKNCEGCVFCDYFKNKEMLMED